MAICRLSPSLLNLHSIQWLLAIFLSFHTVTALNTMCTSNHSGGFGCNFDRGEMCGGMTAGLHAAEWVAGKGSNGGPLEKDWAPNGKGNADGQYIYAKPGPAGESDGYLYVILSENVFSVCVNFRYASTGSQNHVLSISLHDGEDTTLLDEIKEHTHGQWGEVSVPICLPEKSRRHIVVKVDNISEESTVAIDYFEIVLSNRTCPKRILSLHCACDCVDDSEGNGDPEETANPLASTGNPVANTCSKDTSGAVGCDFNKHTHPICGGIEVISEQKDGPVWVHSSSNNDAPLESTWDGKNGYMFVKPGTNAKSKTSMSGIVSIHVFAVCINFYYATTGGSPLRLRIYHIHDDISTLLEELVVNTFGKWEHANVSCCIEGGSYRAIHFETSNVTADNTLAIDHIEITRSALSCPNNTYIIPTTPAATSTTMLKATTKNTNAAPRTTTAPETTTIARTIAPTTTAAPETTTETTNAAPTTTTILKATTKTTNPIPTTTTILEAPTTTSIPETTAKNTTPAPKATSKSETTTTKSEPNPPTEPETPVKPQPETPTEPETPVKPHPETPTEPETPVKPKPEIPTEPETPVKPQPETPVKPQPKTPIEPEASVKPEPEAPQVKGNHAAPATAPKQTKSGGPDVTVIVVGSVAGALVLALIVVGLIFRQRIRDRFLRQKRYEQSDDSPDSPSSISRPNPIYDIIAAQEEIDEAEIEERQAISSPGIILENPLYNRTSTA